MIKHTVYIDGQSGTTGLQIFDRLEKREDLEILRIDPDLRHDEDERRRLMKQAEITFLCLPDAEAVRAVALAEGTGTRIIDASTAHRTAEGWVYGFAELIPGQRARIAESSRVANPGCHATGFLSIAAPLVQAGLLSVETQLSCFSLTGYSGGGKAMIAEYEDTDRAAGLSSPALYALELSHKHLPEMAKYAGLHQPPLFLPVVDDYREGMASTILFAADALSDAGPDQVRSVLSAHYEGASLIEVKEGDFPSRLYANALAGSSRLELYVYGNNCQVGVTALFDNLGKGASGAAVQNMNLMLGLPETTGLL